MLINQEIIVNLKKLTQEYIVNPSHDKLNLNFDFVNGRLDNFFRIIWLGLGFRARNQEESAKDQGQ